MMVWREMLQIRRGLGQKRAQKRAFSTPLLFRSLVSLPDYSI